MPEGAGTKVGDAFVEFGTRQAKLDKGFQEAGKKVSKFGARTTKETSRFLHNIAMMRTAIGLFQFVLAGLAVRGFGKLVAQAGKFQQLSQAASRQFGKDSDVIITKLNKVASGTISNQNLVGAANRAFALGVTDNLEDLATLLEFARLRARALGTETTDAFNDIVTGIGRGSPLILDNLGIITKGWDKEAKAAGKAMDAQFILNKVLSDAREQLKKTGDLTLSNSEAFAKAGASMQNFGVSVGQTLIELLDLRSGAISTSTGIDYLTERLNAAQRSIIVFNEVAKAAGKKLVVVFGAPFKIIADQIGTFFANMVSIFENIDDLVLGKINFEDVWVSQIDAAKNSVSELDAAIQAIDETMVENLDRRLEALDITKAAREENEKDLAVTKEKVSVLSSFAAIVKRAQEAATKGGAGVGGQRLAQASVPGVTGQQEGPAILEQLKQINKNTAEGMGVFA